MAKWEAGNIPERDGLYWITVQKDSDTSLVTYDTPVRFQDRRWQIPRPEGNITAYMELEKPAPYNPKKIGISGEFYIKVTYPDGTSSIYSKQLQPIEWSKIGYSTKEKAIAAMKRLKKLDLEDTAGKSAEYIYEIYTGEGDLA